MGPLMSEEHLIKLRLRNTITITFYDEHYSALDAGEFAKKREMDLTSRSSLTYNILDALTTIRKTKNGGVHVTVVPIREVQE